MLSKYKPGAKPAVASPNVSTPVNSIASPASTTSPAVSPGSPSQSPPPATVLPASAVAIPAASPSSKPVQPASPNTKRRLSLGKVGIAHLHKAGLAHAATSKVEHSTRTSAANSTLLQSLPIDIRETLDSRQSLRMQVGRLGQPIPATSEVYEFDATLQTLAYATPRACIADADFGRPPTYASIGRSAR